MMNLPPKRCPPQPPEPMPDIREALMYIQDAHRALEREIWNKSQLHDAINSAEYFIALAKSSLTEKQE